MIDPKTGRFLKGHKAQHKPGYRKRMAERLTGHDVSEQTREKLRRANLGLKHGPASEERKRKIAQKLKGNKNGVGRRVSDYERLIKSRNNPTGLAWQRILAEIPALEAQGFTVIPITKVIPDMIALRDGKVYAIEVEHSKPDYDKYKNGYGDYFHEVIWILRKLPRKKRPVV